MIAAKMIVFTYCTVLVSVLFVCFCFLQILVCSQLPQKSKKKTKKQKKNANTPTGRGDACRLADYLLTGIRTRLILNRNEGLQAA